MLSEATAYLEKAYSVLNEVYFGGKLPKVIITIMSTPKAYGHVTIGKTWVGSNERYRELNIGAEHLNRPIENLLCTLLHECCHVYALDVAKVADCSKGGKYHNKIFKKNCEERDLHVESDKYNGYSKTTPTLAFIEKLKACGLYGDSIENYRLTAGMLGGSGSLGGSGGDNDGDGDKITPKKKNYVRVYLCVDCGLKVRATVDCSIACLKCDVAMARISKND